MSERLELNRRVAVIVGASSGIGRATAKVLAARGATVVLLARRADRLEALATEIAASGGRATSHAVDVTKLADLSVVARNVDTEFGPASIVFNNAGVMLPTPLADAGRTDWGRQVDLNIVGFNNVVQVFSSQLIASAELRGVADLINTSSISARTAFPRFSVYAASKAYVSHFGDQLRTELGPLNVRVTTLEPGIVETELQSHISDAQIRQRLEGTRHSIEWLQPEDLAETVAFVVGLPARVNLARIAVLPTRQVG